MADHINERIAENFVALLPFSHKKMFRPGRRTNGMRTAQYRVLGILMREDTALSLSEPGKRMYNSKP